MRQRTIQKERKKVLLLVRGRQREKTGKKSNKFILLQFNGKVGVIISSLSVINSDCHRASCCWPWEMVLAVLRCAEMVFQVLNIIKTNYIHDFIAIYSCEIAFQNQLFILKVQIPFFFVILILIYSIKVINYGPCCSI